MSPRTTCPTCEGLGHLDGSYCAACGASGHTPSADLGAEVACARLLCRVRSDLLVAEDRYIQPPARRALIRRAALAHVAAVRAHPSHSDHPILSRQLLALLILAEIDAAPYRAAIASLLPLWSAPYLIYQGAVYTD